MIFATKGGPGISLSHYDGQGGRLVVHDENAHERATVAKDGLAVLGADRKVVWKAPE
jgi:hypothetical protein